MAQTYTRQSSFSDGDTITAALFNDEYNQLVNAFSYSSSDASATGHRHDGTAGQGGNIHTIGDLDFLNKIVVDSTNNRWGVYVEVSGSAVEQIRIQDGAIVPVTDNDIDLGTSSLEFKDLFLDGTATVDTLSVDANATVAGTLGVTGAATLSSTLALTGAATLSSTLAVTGTTTLTGNVTTTNDLSVGGNLTVTGTTTFNGGTITMGDAATDNVVFGADVDSHIIPDDDNTYDLGSSSQEWRDLYVDGTAYLDAINFNGTAITATAAELNYLDVTTLGTVEASKAVVADANAAVKFGDNGVLNFGTGSDLQLYHDGSNSYIFDQGTGYLVVMSGGPGIRLNKSDAEIMIDAATDGAVTLYHDNAAKLATTATGIDVTGAVTANGGVIVDNITIDGTEIDLSSGDLTIDVAGDIILDADGQDIKFKDGGTEIGSISLSGSNVSIISAVQDEDIFFKGNDGGSSIDALYLDMSEAGEATFNDDINLGDNKRLRMGAGGDFEIFHDGSNNYIKGASSNQDLIFQGVDDGSAITALTLDMSEAGAATFNSTIGVGTTNIDGAVTAFGNSDTIPAFSMVSDANHGMHILHRATDGDFSFEREDAGTKSEFMRVDRSSGNVSFNESVGIGTFSPDSTLHVHAASAGSVTALSGTNLTVEGNANNYLSLLSPDANLSALVYGSPSSTNNASINSSYNSGSPYLNFNTGGSEAMRIDSSGNVGIGVSDPGDYDSRAERLVVGESGDAGITIACGSSSDARLVFAVTDQTDLSNGSIGYDQSNDTMAFETAGSERLRIDSSGRVGVGVTPESWAATFTPVQVGAAASFVGSIDTSNARVVANAYWDTTDNRYEYINSDFASAYNQVDSEHQWLIAASGTADAAISFTQAMTLDASGNLGIGTTSPAELVVLDKSSGRTFIRFDKSGTFKGLVGITDTAGDGSSDSAVGDIILRSETRVLLDTGGTTRAVVDASGNAGIGTTSPSSRLTVSGAFDATSAGSKPSITGAGNYGGGIGFIDTNVSGMFTDTSGANLKFFSNQSSSDTAASKVAMTIDGSSNLLVGRTSTLNAGQASILGAASKQALTLQVTSDGNSLIQGFDSSGNLEFQVTGGGAVSTGGQLSIATTGAGNGLGCFLNQGTGGNFYEASDGTKTMIAGTDGSQTFVKLGSLSNHSVGLVTNNTERVSIDTSGEITFKANAGSVSHVFAYNEDGGEIKLADNTGATGTLIDQSLNSTRVLELINGSNLALGLGSSNTTGNILFYKGGFGEAARINPSGNLLVGQTVGTLFGQTSANGVTLGGTGAIQAACTTTVLFLNRLDASGGQVVRFDTNGTQVGSISTTSSATAYNTSSDQRLKENIVDAPSASDDIDAIQVRSFDWKADGSHQKYGMVAQELVTVAPSAVSQPKDPEEMMSVDYSKLVPMMLKEIQQLRARVAQLEGDN